MPQQELRIELFDAEEPKKRQGLLIKTRTRLQLTLLLPDTLAVSREKSLWFWRWIVLIPPNWTGSPRPSTLYNYMKQMTGSTGGHPSCFMQPLRAFS